MCKCINKYAVEHLHISKTQYSEINKDKPQPVFEAHLDAIKAFKQFRIENLNSLLVEKMYEYDYDYVHEHLVPI